jgi:hypothetical protein
MGLPGDLIWKRITHALVSSGRVAELHQELDIASRTGREDSRTYPLNSGGGDRY